MNARNLPLSAFLLTAALAAQAQLLNPQAGGSGFTLPNSGLSGLGGSAGSDPLNDDMTFKCGTVPYRQCTADELNRQENVKRAGRCPMSPATDACASFLMRSSANGGANPAQTIAAYTPPPGQKWASPDCQRIPCALAPDDSNTVEEIVVTAPRRESSPKPGDADFIGPPCPPEVCGGGANNSGLWDSQFEAIKEKNPGAVSVGNERYIVPDPEDPSKWHECTPMMCKRDPVDGSKYADQIQAARANAAMFNVASHNSDQGRTKSSSSSQQQQDPIDPNPTSGAPSTASSDAGDVLSALRSMDRGGEGSGTMGSSWTGTGSGGSGTNGSGSPAGAQTVKIDGGTISSDLGADGGITFTGNQEMLRRIDAARKDVDSGNVDGMLTTGGQSQAELRGRIAEPPVDSRFVGKQQWVPASGSDQK